jgi:uroporphyrinogen decarboxylase
MDSNLFQKRFGKRVVFHGGVDEQWVLPYGSVRDVEEEVLPENVVTMFDAAHRYGKYPI